MSSKIYATIPVTQETHDRIRDARAQLLEDLWSCGQLAGDPALTVAEDFDGYELRFGISSVSMVHKPVEVIRKHWPGARIVLHTRREL